MAFFEVRANAHLASVRSLPRHAAEHDVLVSVVSSLWRAAHELLIFLEGTGRKNILIQIASEIDVVLDHTPYDLFAPDRQAEMIVALREKHPGFLCSTSGGGAQTETGSSMPSPALVEADDYVLSHGNGLRSAGVEVVIKASRARAGTPGCSRSGMGSRRRR